ncbi:hypothetical protein [Streptomyces sp. ZSW22]|uniref:hypothetical protein n=1 Tax=Streptomyces sp. ZSW22 TaxID=3055050 RepID=UPI0025B0D966|nr:hypothetical protein [Streptomyces sp. ZSW22]
MDDSSAKRQRKHPRRRDRHQAATATHLRKWARQQGRNLTGEFLQGVAYKLGSGAVTLLFLWWQARH